MEILKDQELTQEQQKAAEKDAAIKAIAQCTNNANDIYNVFMGKIAARKKLGLKIPEEYILMTKMAETINFMGASILILHDCKIDTTKAAQA